MKVSAAYFSPTGGTEKVVKIIGDEMAAGGQIRYIDLTQTGCNFSKYEMEAGEILVAGVPVFCGRVPAVCIERIKKFKGGGAMAVPVAVYGNRAVEDALLELSDALTEAGFRVIAGIDAVAQHSIAPAIAEGRPDSADEAELKLFAQTIKGQAALAAVEGDSSEAMVEAPIPGNRPYQPMKDVKLYPHADERCMVCGLCASKCPVGAIPMSEPYDTVEEKCISCMRCVRLCPIGSRSVDEERVRGTETHLKEVCPERNVNRLYI